MHTGQAAKPEVTPIRMHFCRATCVSLTKNTRDEEVRRGVEGDLGCLAYMYYRADLSVRNRLFLKAKAILQPIPLYFEIFLKAKAIWHPIFLYSLRDVERRPVLCSFRRIEGSIVSTSFLTSMD